MKRRVKVATLVHWKTPSEMKWSLMLTCGHLKFIDIAWKERSPGVQVCNAPTTTECKPCRDVGFEGCE